MDESRAKGMPPKLGIKKRKPRPSAVIDVANSARKSAITAEGLLAYPPAALVARVPAVAGPAVDLSERFHDDAHCLAHDAETAKRKGLRHFAIRVSRKVEEKSVTTYNEVADELVIEEKELKQQEVDAGGKAALALQKKLAKNGSLVDEKNIRRRVYDSLNVLMAMGIIAKEKKLISWRGLAMARGGGRRREVTELQTAIADQRQAIDTKRGLFAELEDQTTTFAALIRRNASDAVNAANGTAPNPTNERVYTPFIVVQTSTDSNIELEMDQVREDVSFTFSAPFAIFDDREIMRRMCNSGAPDAGDTKLGVR